ncbi:hypothetical protein bcere0005_51130 [Bacillus cereus 172560W]|nr:hypothetical protein bcere0005_51130 [Bacillus cereus 172560W]
MQNPSTDFAPKTDKKYNHLKHRRVFHHHYKPYPHIFDWYFKNL